MATQPVVLRITHQNILNTSTKFLPDEIAGFNVDVQFEDAVGAEAFGVAIGDYDVVTATASGWTLYPPPGSAAVLSGNVGTVADPKSFMLDAPNRYLVELIATAFIDDGGGTPTLVGATPDRITALVEVADGNILFGGGVASMPAARETDEYDTSTGWSGSGMAYFIELSKMMGGARQLMNGVNSNGAQIDQFKIVTPTTASAMETWKGVNASDDPDEYQNHLVRMIGEDATSATLLTQTLGLCMRTAADGVRTSYLMKGYIPFDVAGAGWLLGDLLYVSSNASAAGDLVNVAPVGGGDVVRAVGCVVSIGNDTATSPGVIYFNGVDQFFLPLRVAGGNSITLDFDAASGEYQINLAYNTDWYHSENRFDPGGAWGAFLVTTTGAVKVATQEEIDLTATGIAMMYEMPSPSFASGATRDEVYKLMHEFSVKDTGNVDVECILRGSDTVPAVGPPWVDADVREHASVLCDPFTIRRTVVTGDTLIALPEIRTLSRYIYLEVLTVTVVATGTPVAILKHSGAYSQERV